MNNKEEVDEWEIRSGYIGRVGNKEIEVKNESIFLVDKKAFADLLAQKIKLELTLRRIRNSVAIASWSVKPEFRQWAKDMNKLIQESLDDVESATKK